MDSPDGEPGPETLPLFASYNAQQNKIKKKKQTNKTQHKLVNERERKMEWESCKKNKLHTFHNKKEQFTCTKKDTVVLCCLSTYTSEIQVGGLCEGPCCA